MTSWSHALEQHRAALSAANAKRRNAALAAGALEHLEHVQHDTRARGADGMADGDGTAIDVYLLAAGRAERAIKAEVLLAIRRFIPGSKANRAPVRRRLR